MENCSRKGTTNDLEQQKQTIKPKGNPAKKFRVVGDKTKEPLLEVVGLTN